ncbi:hypothetical protein GIB67_041427 [Kingdonia uniflora]|uniref:BED-type domain-containing protein n=1 Tax=Kingdonia uniflora TaxID=39325 RepID=A0A7J7LRQ3_9MAGN|nr:hypothetical protein GIB67_041427 [Kingdonia uniflora]
MATTQESNNVYQYGLAISEQKNRVQCNYCAKVVSGFAHLKQHLGGIRGDVVPCEQVPQDVIVKMRKDLVEKRSTNLKREVLQLIDSDVPLTRDVCSNSTNESKQSPFVPAQTNCKRKDNVACVTPRENVPKKVLHSNKMGYSPGAAKTKETDEDSSMHAKSVGRFFYENGINFSVVKSPSFLKMIYVVVRSVRPSLTLENIVLEKGNLQKMFGSSTWNTSIWALRADGKRVADLIEGLSFRSKATKVLKATIPLVRALHLVKGGDKDKKIPDLILQQLDEYREAKGPFGWINVVDQRSEIPPEKWLWDCESNAKEGDGNSDEMIDPMGDWNIDEAVTPQSNVDSVAWMNSNTIDIEKDPSMIQPKKE